MILTSDEILKEVGFEPGLDVFQFRPHAVDLRLATDITIMNGRHVTAKTFETVKLPADVCGVVFPRSSTNRLGVTLDMTGIVDANYEGQLILPLSYHGEYDMIKLPKGQRVASIMFFRLSKKAADVKSKYHNSDGSYVPDSADELSFIETGNIEGLKERFKV